MISHCDIILFKKELLFNKHISLDWPELLTATSTTPSTFTRENISWEESSTSTEMQLLWTTTTLEGIFWIFNFHQTWFLKPVFCYVFLFLRIFKNLQRRIFWHIVRSNLAIQLSSIFFRSFYCCHQICSNLKCLIFFRSLIVSGCSPWTIYQYDNFQVTKKTETIETLSGIKFHFITEQNSFSCFL